MIRFASLGSGSKGNALLVQSGRTRVLIDCGFGPRVLAQRLARLGVVPEQLDAVLITHEHSDHVAGLAALARRVACPVYLTAGTRRALERRQALNCCPLIELTRGESFVVGDFAVFALAVPHDAAEPVQYILTDGAVRLGVLTDCGRVTHEMRNALQYCDGLVIEFNHDLRMLECGPYPAFLKARIAGPEGHLDNASAGHLLASVAHSGIQHVVGAHLSEKNNAPAIVRTVMAHALGAAPEQMQIASQDDGFDWRTLGGRA